MRLGVILLLAFALALCGQTQSQNAPRELDINGGQSWVDTGLDLKRGDSVSITATGSMQYPQSAANSPDGLARSWKDLMRIVPIKDSGRGAVIGRVGDADTGLPFLIGSRKQFEAVTAGRLFIVNQQTKERPPRQLSCEDRARGRHEHDRIRQAIGFSPSSSAQ